MLDPVPRSHLALQSPESRRISDTFRAKRLRGGSSTTPLLTDYLSSGDVENLVDRSRTIFETAVARNRNIARNYIEYTEDHVPNNIKKPVTNMYDRFQSEFVRIFIRNRGNNYIADLNRIIDEFQREFENYRTSDAAQTWYRNRLGIRG